MASKLKVLDAANSGEILKAGASNGGHVYWVKAASAADFGQFYDRYFQQYDNGQSSVHSTLQSAINACTANVGDVIYVCQGHAETVSTATALAFNKAGITIVGLGNGQTRPKFTLDTATTATIAVSAANMVLENCIVSANFADIVAAFTLSATNFKVRRCRIQATATDMNFKYVFDTNATTAACDGLEFTDSVWIEPDAATISLCKVDGTNDSWVVARNYISIATQATGGGLFVIATGKVLTNLDCNHNRCRLIGGDLSGAGVVFTTDGSTNSGFFSFNHIQHTDTASEIFGTASSGFSMAENYMSGVAGASGYILPAVDS